MDPIGTDLGWEGRLDEYGALADAIARQAEAGESLRDAVVTVFEHECGFEPDREDLARICGQCGEPDERDYRRRRRLYYGHWAATAILGAVVTALVFRLMPTGDEDVSVGLVVLLVALFLVHALTGLLFKRKTKPWALEAHPDDRRPRR